MDEKTIEALASGEPDPHSTPFPPSPVEAEGDIVERLRTWANDDVRAIAKDMPVMGLKIEPDEVRRWGDLMDEAANEIERLRLANEGGTAMLSDANRVIEDLREKGRENIRLEREIEQLRAALQPFAIAARKAQETGQGIGAKHCDWEHFARAAELVE